MQMNSGPVVQDFARPATLAEALHLRAAGSWQPLAGGTDLYPGAGVTLTGSILDLTGVAELAGITRSGGLRIGAACSWSDILLADLPPALRALQVAAGQVGGRQVQTAGTIGGNLCNASPAADGVPPLLVAEAEVELVSLAGTRRLALAEFLIGPRRTALRTDELMVAVHVPERALAGRSVFLKLGARRHLVISIAMVAARVEVERGRIAEVAVAVGSCGPVAVRLPKVEAALLGQPVAGAVAQVSAEDVVAALRPIDDVRATAAYRGQAAVELVRRGLAEALG
jgi:CO/xanthine dehydrogenase FAD-binding subunit